MPIVKLRLQGQLDGRKPPFPAGGDVSTHPIHEFSESSALSGGSADYVESLYNAWLADPAAVSPTVESLLRWLQGPRGR